MEYILLGLVVLMLAVSFYLFLRGQKKKFQRLLLSINQSLRNKNLMQIKSNKFKGFTLIELLVVVAIISILSSVVMASLNSARVKEKMPRVWKM